MCSTHSVHLFLAVVIIACAWSGTTITAAAGASATALTSKQHRGVLPPSLTTLHEAGLWNMTNVKLPSSICFPNVGLPTPSVRAFELAAPFQDRFDPTVWYLSCATEKSSEGTNAALVRWREGTNFTQLLFNTTNALFASVQQSEVQSHNGTLFVSSMPRDIGLTTPAGVLSVDPNIGIKSLRTIIPYNDSTCSYPQQLQVHGDLLIISCVLNDAAQSVTVLAANITSGVKRTIFPLRNDSCTAALVSNGGWTSISEGELLVVCDTGVFAVELGSHAPTRMLAESDPNNPIGGAWRDTVSQALLAFTSSGLTINRTNSGGSMVVWSSSQLGCSPFQGVWWQGGRVLFFQCLQQESIISLPVDMAQLQDVTTLITGNSVTPLGLDRRDGKLVWMSIYDNTTPGGLIVLNGRIILTPLHRSQCVGMNDVVSDFTRSAIHVACSTQNTGSTIVSLFGGVYSKLSLTYAGCDQVVRLGLRQDGSVDVLCWNPGMTGFIVGVANLTGNVQSSTFVWQSLPVNVANWDMWSSVRGPLILFNTTISTEDSPPVSLFLLPSTTSGSISAQGLFVFADAFSDVPLCPVVSTLAEVGEWLFVGCADPSTSNYNLFALPWGDSAVLPGSLQLVLPEEGCGASIGLWPDPDGTSLWVACPVGLFVLEVQGSSWSWANQTYAMPSIANVDGSSSFGVSNDMAFMVDADMNTPHMVIVDLRRGDVWRAPVCSDYAKFTLDAGSSTPYVVCTLSSELLALPPSFLCTAGSAWFDGACSACNPGSARNSKNSDIFQWYAPQCETCAPNSIAPYFNSPSCSVCPPGSVQPNIQTQSCQFCERNTFPLFLNASTLPTCAECPAGFEAPQSGSVSCSPCKLGSLSGQGEPCVQCAGASYAPASNASSCVSCIGSNKGGLSCSDGIASVLPDWWAFLSDSPSPSFQTTKCPLGFCPGSPLQTADANQTLQLCLYPRRNDPTNWLCAECENGFLPWGSRCDSCTGLNGTLFTGAIFAIIAFVVFTLVSGTSSAGHLSILIYFVQIAALQLPVGSEAEWISWFAVVNPGAKSVRSCIAPLSPLQQYILTFALPLILQVAMLIISAAHWTIRSCVEHHRVPEAVVDSESSYLSRFAAACKLDSYISCSLSLCLFSYTSVSVAVVESLNCVEVAPGVRRLFAAPTVDCDSSAYRSFFPLCITVLLLFVVGFPLATIIFLWRQRRQQQHQGQVANELDLQLLHPEAAKNADEQKQSPNPSQSTLSPFAQRYGALFLAFRSTAWFWQPTTLLRRFALALVSVMLSTHPTQQYVVFASLHLLFFVCHLLALPFDNAQMNYVDSAVYLLLVAQANVLAAADSPDNPSFPVQLTVFLLIAVPTLLLIVWTVRSKWSLIFSSLKKLKGFVTTTRTPLPDLEQKSIEEEEEPQLSYSAPKVSVLKSATSFSRPSEEEEKVADLNNYVGDTANL